VNVVFVNRQRIVRVNTAWLKRAAAMALKRCSTLSADGGYALRQLEEVGIALVSDATIARLHYQFLGEPGPTDVLTFEHGEVIISAETAAANSARFCRATEIEIALYTIHGFLHLNGFDDRTVREAARMRRAQRGILRWCRAQLPPP
jgi:probable rRNA maturation factor